jgi:hypothetical protein
MNTIDVCFVDDVEAILGPATNVEVTGAGRTVLRYDATDDRPAFVVSMEARRPVACRRVGTGVEFAAVGPDGLGEWCRSKLELRAQPGGTHGQRVRTVKRMAEDGFDAREIARRVKIGHRTVKDILAA